MTETKYQMNEVVFFVHGQKVIKGVIDEIILHHTQSKKIVKYIIRPYGLKDYVTIDKIKLYDDIETAKRVVIDDLKRTYTKDNLKKNYEDAQREMKKKFKTNFREFDKNLEDAMNMINATTEDFYDKLEKEYQENQKENKNESDS